MALRFAPLNARMLCNSFVTLMLIGSFCYFQSFLSDVGLFVDGKYFFYSLTLAFTHSTAALCECKAEITTQITFHAE